MSRPARLIELTHLLGGRRSRRLEEFVERFGVSQRTVFRDLADLERHGIPIVRDDAGYRLLEHATLRPLNLTAQERAILKVALDNKVLRRAAPLRRSLELLEAKLDAVTRAVEETPEGLRLAGLDRSGARAEGAIEPLRRAVAQRQSVEFQYASLSASRRGWRGLDPYEVFHRDAWYVVGRCHTHAETRIFRLDRIAEIRALGVGFERPPFDLEEFLRDSWTIYRGDRRHDVVVRFARELAPLVENGLHHASERIERRADGGLEYRVQLGHLDEIARWVVGFGGRARAIAPDELVKRVRELAGGAAEEHGEPGRPQGRRRRKRP